MSAAAQQKHPAPVVAPPSATPKPFPDDWYLLPYEPSGKLSQRWLWLLLSNPGWRTITAAFTISALLGLTAAALYNHPRSGPPATVALQAKPLPPLPSPSQDELERLEIRNRRLEALIKVLRERKQSRVHVHPAHSAPPAG